MSPKILALPVLALVGLTGSAFLLMDGASVHRCCDATGSCTWASSASECPTGTTPIEVELHDACDPPTGPSCSPCPPGGPCPPEGTEPIDYLCCEMSSPLDCFQVHMLTDCPGTTHDIFPCEYGMTNPDGSETCYP